jgi:hypothetical protein
MTQVSRRKVLEWGILCWLGVAMLVLVGAGCDFGAPGRTGKTSGGGPVPPWTGREDEFDPDFLRYVRAHPQGTRESPVDVLFPIKDNKYGYMDRAGNLVVPPVFGFVMPRDPECNDGTGDPQRLHPVQAGKWDSRRRTYFDHWGYVDNCGKVRILPRFDFALPFEGGYAPVQVGAEEGERFGERLGNTKRSVAGGKWGIIDETGEFVVPPRYSHCTSFGEDGLAAVGAAGGKWGYVNRKGRMVISPRFDFAGPFWEGLAVVNIGKKPDEDVGDHSWWAVSGKWGVIDTTGHEVIPIDRASIDCWGFRKGMARAYDKAADGWRMGLIDAQGRWVVPAQFSDIRHFDEGVAQVRVGEYWGLINKDGEFVLKPRYAKMLPFSEGLAAVAVETTKGSYHGWRWGFIDHTGRLRIQTRFSAAESFSQGLAAVAVGEYAEAWGYIDRHSEWWIRPQFMRAWPFLRGLAEVKLQDGRYRYINREGEVVADAYSPG